VGQKYKALDAFRRKSSLFFKKKEICTPSAGLLLICKALPESKRRMESPEATRSILAEEEGALQQRSTAC